MRLSRSIPLGLLTAGLLATACGTEHRKSKAPKAPKAQPELPINPIEKDQNCAWGQVLDADNKSCRKPTERECLERNTVFSGVTCGVNFPTLSSSSVNAPKINLAEYCEKNTAGAFVNCKNGDYALPVASIAHVDGTPEVFKTLAVDQEIKLEYSIKQVGEVKVTVELEAETVDLLKPTDSTIPWLLRNLKVGDSIPLKVIFAPDTVIHSQSEIRIPDQFVTYHDKSQILAAIADKTVTNKWLAEETERQRKVRIYKSSLNNEWLSFLKNEVKGAVVWTVNEKCPADQQRNLLATSVCLVDQTIKSNPNWKNRAFIYTCSGPRAITIDYPQERYGLLNYGKFQNEAFSILIPKNTPFIGPACFIKIIE